MRTAYAVAFDDSGRFLMVFNHKRNGWEMPGGHVEDGETSEHAATRETMEESGYEIEIVSSRNIGYCDVCAARIIGKTDAACEMESCMFDIIPEQLSFDRAEYEDTIPWARRQLGL